MTRDMTQGSPIRLLLTFSFPLLIGNLFQQFYNMADTIIVGRTLGVNALAAVGATGSIMFLVLGFAQGLAGGLALSLIHISCRVLLIRCAPILRGSRGRSRSGVEEAEDRHPHPRHGDEGVVFGRELFLEEDPAPDHAEQAVAADDRRGDDGVGADGEDVEVLPHRLAEGGGHLGLFIPDHQLLLFDEHHVDEGADCQEEEGELVGHVGLLLGDHGVQQQSVSKGAQAVDDAVEDLSLIHISSGILRKNMSKTPILSSIPLSR